MSAIIRLNNITKIYHVGSEDVHALAGISIEIKKNEYVAIMGPSGSGKSTLMNIVGCLDTPTSGLYELNTLNVSEMNDNQLARVRNKEIGFVFQTFNLLARSDVLHNVELPLIYGGVNSSERKKLAKRSNCKGRIDGANSPQTKRALGRSAAKSSDCTSIGYGTFNPPCGRTDGKPRQQNWR